MSPSLFIIEFVVYFGKGTKLRFFAGDLVIWIREYTASKYLFGSAL